MSKKTSLTKTREFCINWIGCTAGVLLVFVYAAAIVSATRNEAVTISWWRLLGAPAAGAIGATLLTARSDRT